MASNLTYDEFGLSNEQFFTHFYYWFLDSERKKMKPSSNSYIFRNVIETSPN